jgi:hypothetical protein
MVAIHTATTPSIKQDILGTSTRTRICIRTRTRNLTNTSASTSPATILKHSLGLQHCVASSVQ